MIPTLLKALELKDEKRTGQQLYSIEDPDSIAGHSWTVSILTLVYGREEEVNMEKALKLALVHDLAEAEIGDFATRTDSENQKVSEEEKEMMEHDAITEMSEGLNTHEIRMLWKEYEKGESPEAEIVNDMDHIEKCLTALKNEKEDNYSPEDNKELPYDNLDEFFLTAEDEFKTKIGKQIFKELKSRYEEEKS
ncbi:MAG: HD domain-containing protein [Candidatus Nanohaloarchaea archaeon]